MSEKSIISPNGGKLGTIVPFVLTGKDVDSYLTEGVVFTISVQITFEDAMRETNQQVFKQRILANINGASPFDQTIKIATEENNQCKEKAN
jgi:hypothetical protein